jgi:gliding motility associated protien GldN
MSKLKRIIICVLGLTVGGNAFSQSSYEDWTYRADAVKERKVIPHRYIREGNVKYYKRIHRVIDARQKQNLVMHWPRNPFYRVITEAAYKGGSAEGGITAYLNDSLTSFYTPDELKARGGSEYPTTIQDWMYPDDETATRDTVLQIPFKPEDIQKYRIMEDWVFDNNYSDFRANIIAIAPMFMQMSSGAELGEVALFWARMTELRPLLVNQEVFNTYNDAARLSFDDFFEMRMFDSYIVKESNVEDLDIKRMERFQDDAFSALLESDRIKNDLFILEHDLWEY